MTRLLRLFRMPLLWKELVEQASRKRTYLIRVLYAVLFFLIFLMMTERIFSRTVTNAQMLLGTGKRMFEALLIVQFAGIYTFLPAMISGVITFEKERETLSLLFLTQLSSGKILVQKYLGRLIPMFIFIMLGLPLMSIAYSYGGMTVDNMLSGFYLLLLCSLQIGAIGLMMSAYCRTSVSAFIWTYIVGGLFLFGLLILYLVGEIIGLDPDFDEDVVLAFFAPFLYFDNTRDTFGEILLRSIPIVISTAVFLRLGYKFLVKRAFVPSRNVMLRVLKKVDWIMNRLNHVTGGIVVIKSDSKPLTDNPIEWREMSKRSLGSLRYRIRIFVLIWIPVLFISAGAILADRSYYRNEAEELSAILFFLWSLISVTLPALTVNSITSEYSNQTLPVLLSTPIKGPSIVQQKLAVVKSMFPVLGIPLATIFLTEAWFEYGLSRSWKDHEIGTFMYVLSSVLSVVVYFPFLMWFSMWVALKVKKKGKALIITISSIAAWLFIPIFLAILSDVFFNVDLDEFPGMLLGIMSPALILILTEFNEFGIDNFPEFWILLNYMFYGGVTLFFRWRCLEKSDEYLGRS